ncbi:MAG: M23 family metallopeptidase [Myxococcota bacterium]|jgi:murein DD-endopeptidase MepM/ murein hydrolase activator NlpD|nr:M23 family metallopeptidase [Myxococcota bacterium]
MNTTQASARIAIGLVLFACSESSPSHSETPIGDTPPIELEPLLRGESAQRIVDEGGDELLIGNLRLEVPAGALAEATTITVTEVDPSAAPGIQAIGPIYLLEPSGLRFLRPATLHFQLEEFPANELSTLSVFLSQGEERVFEAIDAVSDENTVRAPLEHFSLVALGLPNEEAPLWYPLDVAITGTTYANHPDNAVDYACWENLVYAAKDGQLTHAHDGCQDNQAALHNTWSQFSSCGGGYGNHIRTLNNDGSTNIYGHLREGSLLVQVGDYVCAGQAIARCGASGKVKSMSGGTGAHLHFGYRNPLGEKVYPPHAYAEPEKYKGGAAFLEYCDDIDALHDARSDMPLLQKDCEGYQQSDAHVCAATRAMVAKVLSLSNFVDQSADFGRCAPACSIEDGQEWATDFIDAMMRLHRNGESFAFNPASSCSASDAMTRLHLVKALVIAFGLPLSTPNSLPVDAALVDSSLLPYLSAAVAAGIIPPDRPFYPNRFATLGDLAELVAPLLQDATTPGADEIDACNSTAPSCAHPSKAVFCGPAGTGLDPNLLYHCPNGSTVALASCAPEPCLISTASEDDRCELPTGCPAVPCPSPSYGDWSSCSYPDLCTEQGNRSRHLTSYTCIDATCQAQQHSEDEACSRETDGNACGSAQQCSNGVCGTSCTPLYTAQSGRACDDKYCFELIACDAVTTRVRFSKLDNSAFGNFSLYFRVQSGSTSLVETTGFCDPYEGQQGVEASFATSKLGLDVGQSASISATLWVGPEQHSCQDAHALGSRTIQFDCG